MPRARAVWFRGLRSAETAGDPCIIGRVANRLFYSAESGTFHFAGSRQSECVKFDIKGRTMNRSSIILILAFAGAVACAQTPADTIYYNGKIVTMWADH